jgi:hypothetical protein
MINTYVDNKQTNKQTNKILGTQTFKFGSVVSFAGDWVVRRNETKPTCYS